MEKEKFLKKWGDKAKHPRGVDGRLSQVELQVNSKGYAPLLFFGDVHWGHKSCNEKAVYAMLDWVLENNVYLIFMGDALEMGTRDSYGLWEQKLNPDEQVNGIIELMQPIADKGLIIGWHRGNHCERVSKSTGVDITRIICNSLNVKYFGYSHWTSLKVTDGKQHQNYSLYSTHGRGGSRFKHTQLKSVVDKMGWTRADIIAMGHLHGLSAEPVPYEYIDWKDKQVKAGKCYCTLTGSYLNWAGSYAEDGGYPVNKIGSPKAKLRADYKDIHFSL